jgi:GDP-4-dehydro-6-deoxy-D-mannose reductase
MYPIALITGASGFVGPHLAKHLIEKGISVCGTYLSKDDISYGQAPIRYMQWDVHDAGGIRDIVQKVQPDYVFHLAGFSSVGKSWNNKELVMKVNIGGTRNVLDAIKSANIEPKILVVSSAEVYGIPNKIPVPEEHQIAPVSPYGESRKMQEELCRQYDLPIIISRSFNHTGPGQGSEFVCADFAKQVSMIESKKQDPLIRVGDLSVRRDFSDVRDISEAYLLALQKGDIGETYNICSGRGVAIKQILDVMIGFSSSNISIESDRKKFRETDIPEMVGDNSKFCRKTGWKQKTDLSATLGDLLEYYRDRI